MYRKMYLITDECPYSLFQDVPFELGILVHLFLNPVRLETVKHQIKRSFFQQLFTLSMS